MSGTIQQPIEMKYMKEAIRQAKKAAALGDVPIGCVIEYQGKIIGRGYNRRMADKTVLAHAEILAMKKACKKMGDWRLEDCTMYVTLEPCPMCAGAIVQARIPRVVIGCLNPKAGCAGSVLDLLHQEGFNHQVETSVGLCGEECSRMLSDFFKELRKKKADKKAGEKAGAKDAEKAGGNGTEKIRTSSQLPVKPVGQEGHGDGEEDLQGAADDPRQEEQPGTDSEACQQEL